MLVYKCRIWDELKSRIYSSYLFKPDIIVITEIYPKHSLYETAISELSICD